MDYHIIKTIHQTAVALSVTGFFVRGLLSLGGSALAHTRVARILPQVIDTVLLISAVTLAATLRINPLHAPWLLAKLVGLVVYIALGMVALRAALPWSMRAGAFVAAMVTAAWIISAAITKSPLGFVSWLG